MYRYLFANPLLIYKYPTSSRNTTKITFKKVINKTIILALLLSFSLLLSLQVNLSTTSLPYLLLLTLALTILLRKDTSKLIPLYATLHALAEGALLGILIKLVNNKGHDLLTQALLLTLVTLASIIILYYKKVIYLTPNFKNIFNILTTLYFLLSLGNIIALLLKIDSSWGLYHITPIGLAISLLGTSLASASLLRSFERIKKLTSSSTDEIYSWKAASAIMLSIIWLYFELLKVLYLLRRVYRA